VTIIGRGRPVILGQTLFPAEAQWEIAGNDAEPDALARFELRDGRPECVEIRIAAKSNGRGLRTSDLGLWQLDNFTVNVFDFLGEPIEPDPSGRTATAQLPSSEAEQWAVRRDITEARLSRRGRRAPTHEELERVADVYREHFDSGAPVRAVAAALGLSGRTAARRVEQARGAGLLPRTTRGRAKA
jgi:hypothetical protein